MTPQQLAEATGATLTRAAYWQPFLTAAMKKHGIDTPLRQAAFLGQLAVESARLSVLEENLSYSVQRLRAVWPRRFKTDADAAPYARKPETLANHVYGGRMGNTAPGDGWKYRGRGLKQLTGRHNYIEYMLASGIDCVEHPDLLLQPEHAADSAAWFWSSRDCNAIADTRNWQALTRRINGGLIGYNERVMAINRAIKALGVD